VARAGRHFDPGRSTQTDRFLLWLEQRRKKSPRLNP